MSGVSSLMEAGVVAARTIEQEATYVANAKAACEEATRRPETYAQRAVEWAHARGRLEMAEQMFMDLTGETASMLNVARWARS